MKKYTVLLPVLSYTSAFNLSRKHSECTERCNQLPFKVAVESRRSDCIKSCAPKVYDDALSQSAVGRDEICVNLCKDKKGSKRFIKACILRCPEQPEIMSVRNHDYQDEDHLGSTPNATNVTLANPVSQLSENQDGVINASNATNDHSDAVTNNTDETLAGPEAELEYEDATLNASDDTNEDPDDKLNVSTVTLLSENEDGTFDASNATKDKPDTVPNPINVTLAYPVTQLSENEDGIFNASTATARQDQAHIDIDQNSTSVSRVNVESHFSENGDGVYKANTVVNGTYKINSREESELSNEDNKPESTAIASRNTTDQGEEATTTYHSNDTVIPKPIPSDAMSSEEFFTKTIELNMNKTTDVVQDDSTPVTQVKDTPRSNDIAPTGTANNTSSLETPSDPLNASLDSLSRVSHQEVSLSDRDSCVAKCNEKRTLQRKRDACVKRCNSGSSSIPASTLASGYKSIKLEL